MKAVDGVDLDIQTGETLGLVGETGSGKTTLGQSIVCLLRPFLGRIQFKGIEIFCSNQRKNCDQFRRHLQMVFQDPYGSLNPRRTLPPCSKRG